MRCLPFLFSLFLLASCQKAPSGPLEIYRVNQAHPDIRNRNVKGDHCFYCFEPSKDNLYKGPLLLENDIANFDWEAQQIILTESAKAKVNKLHIPKKGLAVAFVLNGEPVYGFWLWTKSTSYGCDRVYAYPREDFKLDFGLPKGFEYGEDPRFNTVLERYVTTKTW
ncbi:MAG: hypothetical protein ACJATF_004105 [Flavobacteriales bacterium]|jgi:hypothetical protein